MNMKTNNTKPSREQTAIHNMVQGAFASALNTQFGDPFSGDAIITRPTCKDGDQFWLYDLISSPDEDRNKHILLTEIKTTRLQRSSNNQHYESASELAKRIWAKNFDQFNQLQLSATHKKCKWLVVIAAYNSGVSRLHESQFNANDYSVLALFGDSPSSYSYNKYSSLQGLFQDIKKAETLEKWLDTSTSYFWTEYPQGSMIPEQWKTISDSPNENQNLDLEIKKPTYIYKKVNKKLLTDEGIYRIKRIFRDTDSKKLTLNKAADEFNVSKTWLSMVATNQYHPNYEAIKAFIPAQQMKPITEEYRLYIQPIADFLKKNYIDENGVLDIVGMKDHLIKIDFILSNGKKAREISYGKALPLHIQQYLILYSFDRETTKRRDKR